MGSVERMKQRIESANAIAQPGNNEARTMMVVLKYGEMRDLKHN